jgi:RNA polymerase sigma-70 factor (ECF subfamily)
MDEAQLQSALEQAKLGSSAAFGQLYGHFARRVFALCRKMLGSAAAAEDATSEVFERARRSLDQCDSERPFDRWLFAIASRHCLNRLRRERLEKRFVSDEPHEGATEMASSPLVACEGAEQRRRLLREIDALPENYREPLVLKYYADLSYDEIAEQLGTTRDNVAVLLYRGKRQLRERISAPRKEVP